MISALTFAPVLAALLILLLPERWARRLALGGALASLVITAWLLSQFNPGGGLQFVEKAAWIPALHVDYFVGLDGTNALVLLLATILAPLAVLASPAQMPRSYYLLLSLQFTGLFGAFTALNFFHWFIFWEMALVPAFFLIKLFGHGEDRHRAALSFFLFTVLGSVAMLLGFLFLSNGGQESFDFIALADKAKSGALQPGGWVFIAVLAGLCVKVPLVPLHLWQAPAYAAAPVPVTMLLTGVMSKMGVYGFLRIIVPIFPQELRAHAETLMVLALVTILWGAFLALRQTQLKRLLAFSSLNHVAFCVFGVGVLGIATNAGTVDVQRLATQGIILQMFAHGITAAGLFYMAGLLERRAGKDGLNDFGGLSAATPRLAIAFYLLAMGSLGLPFLAGFAAEFLIFASAFAVAPTLTVVATLGLLATAVFLLTALQRLFTGPTPEHVKFMPDLSLEESLLLVPVLALVFWVGLIPGRWLAFSAN